MDTTYEQAMQMTAAILANKVYGNFLCGVEDEWSNVSASDAALPLALIYDRPHGATWIELREEIKRMVEVMKVDMFSSVEAASS